MSRKAVFVMLCIGAILRIPSVLAAELPAPPSFLADIRSEADLKSLTSDQQKEMDAYRQSVDLVNKDISSLELVSCTSDKLSGQGMSFSFTPAEKVSFVCQVKNTGSAVAPAFLTSRIVPDAAKNEPYSAVSLRAGEVKPGQTASFDVAFLSPVLSGTYQYTISLAKLVLMGAPSEAFGKTFAYAGTLGASDMRIVSADFDKTAYQWGDQGTLKVTVSQADSGAKVSIDGVDAAGNTCANFANSLPVTQAANEYRFALPKDKPACGIKIVTVSLLSKEGFPLDSKAAAIRIGDMSGAAGQSLPALARVWPFARYGMIAIVAVSIIALALVIGVVLVRRKKAMKIYGLLILFAATAWGGHVPSASAAVTQTITITAATYSGTEQTLEAINLSGMLSKAGSNGGVSGEVQEANSYYQFRATNGTYFTLNGANIGSTLTVVHWRDGLGFANYACDWSNCGFIASYGRGGGATVGVVSATTVGGVSSNYAVGGGAYNGGEQVIEATNISWDMTLAGGNGGVGGWSSYRDSYYQFIATNGVRFTLDGTDIGTTITIVHKQDWVGVASGLCSITPARYGSDPITGELTLFLATDNCSYIATWGRWNRTIGIIAPPVPVVPVVPPAVPADPPLIRATPAVDIKVNGLDTPLSSVPYGTPLTITWSTIEADTCTASGIGWTGPKATSGTETITAADDTTYTLTCTNIVGSNSDSVVVALVPLPVTLTVNGASGTTTLTGGQSVPVVWSAPGATSCEILSGYGWAGSNNTRPASGSDTITIGATSDYKIHCVGAGSGTATVHVDAVCAPVTGAWSACNCDTETKTRTNTNASCSDWTETDVCTASEKNSCRDFNWKEVAP